MKTFLILALLATSISSAFAMDKVCFKNDGAFLADVELAVYDGSSQRWYSKWERNIMTGQTKCGDKFDASKGDYASVLVYHQVFFGIPKETCTYHHIKDSRIVVANGTTFNFWCHDSKL